MSNITFKYLNEFTTCIGKLLIDKVIFLTVLFNFGEIINAYVLSIFIVSLFADDHCSLQESKEFVSNFSLVVLRAFTIMHVSSAYCLMTLFL